MQPGLPIALPAPISATPLIGKPQLGPADFGGALAKLLKALVPAAIPVPTEMPVTAQTTNSPSPTDSTPTPPATLQRLMAGSLTAADISLAAAATQLTPESSVPPAQLQANTTVVRSRASSGVRREPEQDAASALPTAEPVIVESPTTTPIVVPSNVEVQQRPAPAASPTRDDTAGAHKPVAVSKPEAPQPGATQPSDPRATASEAAPAAIHGPAACPDPVTAPPGIQSATITQAPAASPAAATTTPMATAHADSTPIASPMPHPSPAAQIAPALVSLSHGPDGGQQLTMKLQPPDLGQLQIRIDRPATDTPARVAITVEKPETLALLLRDQPQLQRALDQAGVPAEGRSVTFHIATPEPAARTDTTMAPLPTGSTASMSGDLSHGTSGQSGRPSRPDAVPVEDTEEVEATPASPATWLRAGLDITA